VKVHGLFEQGVRNPRHFLRANRSEVVDLFRFPREVAQLEVDGDGRPDGRPVERESALPDQLVKFVGLVDRVDDLAGEAVDVVGEGLGRIGDFVDAG